MHSLPRESSLICSSSRARPTASPGRERASTYLLASASISAASSLERQTSAVQKHSLTLGDFELTAISDGTYVADGGAFFGIIPKVLWERKVKADALNRITVSCNSVLVS